MDRKINEGPKSCICHIVEYPSKVSRIRWILSYTFQCSIVRTILVIKIRCDQKIIQKIYKGKVVPGSQPKLFHGDFVLYQKEILKKCRMVHVGTDNYFRRW